MKDALQELFEQSFADVDMRLAAQERGGYTVVELIWGSQQPSAPTIALLQLVCGAVVGYALSYIIRRFSDPSKGAFSKGIEWSSWGAFFGVLAAARATSEVAAHEFVARFLVLTISWTLIGFVVGYVYARARGTTKKPDREFFEQALTELDNGKHDVGLWAEMLSKSKGNEQVAKSRYIEARARELAAAGANVSRV